MCESISGLYKKQLPGLSKYHGIMRKPDRQIPPDVITIARLPLLLDFEI